VKHEIALLGSALVDQRESVERLENAVERGDWSTACSIKEWRGDADEVEYYVVRCPADKRFALIRVHSYADMWSDDQRERANALTAAETRAIASITSLEWQRV